MVTRPWTVTRSGFPSCPGLGIKPTDVSCICLRRPRSGQSEFSSLNLMKKVDVSTAALLKAVAAGDHMSKVTLMILRPNGTGEWGVLPEDQTSKKSLMVSSVQHSGSAGEDVPTESVSLAFGKVALEFSPANKRRDIKPIIFSWDLKENRQ